MDERLPWIQPYGDAVVKGLNRIGVRFGPVVVLTLNGRKSGELRSTPVTPVEVDGRTYVVAAIGTANWAQNARADGDAAIDVAGDIEAVRLVEVTDPAHKERVVVAFGERGMPGRFLKMVGAAPERTPEGFAQAAPTTAVFEVVPVPVGSGAGAS
ncbi:MAG: hypothetical protein BGO95_09410 [Micrococcales bacterium 73-13]|nr:MAG: hypothetical protein BGO95_09410 [Micrococcales bacterium 73-13]